MALQVCMYVRVRARVFACACVRVVYRGLAGVKLPDVFKVAEEGQGRGGVDFAFMSTTTSMEVAFSYLGEKKLPIVFRIQVGDIDRGCPVSFISQYPKEREHLMPPLSNLEAIGNAEGGSELIDTGKGRVTILDARLNCNLKSKVGRPQG